jgi:hypothetical protein
MIMRPHLRISSLTNSFIHSRLGGGEVEIGTWRVDELKDHPEFEQVFGQCRKLWEDRVLGKLGIPEV